MNIYILRFSKVSHRAFVEILKSVRYTCLKLHIIMKSLKMYLGFSVRGSASEKLLEY